MTGSEFETIERLNDYWDGVVRGVETNPGSLDPALAGTVRQLHAMDDAPAPDPAFGRRLRRELADEPSLSGRPAGSETAAARGRPTSPRIPFFPGRRSLAGLAAALALVMAVGGYLAATQPAPVSAEEIVRKAQEAAASPAAAGINSFVSTERTVARPGNPRMNAYAGLTGEEEIRSETKRWYQAPNRWRIEAGGSWVDALGKELPDRAWRWIGVSDGKDVWRFDARSNEVTVHQLELSPSGKTGSYGAESPLGQGMIDPQKALQTSNPNVRPKLQGEETVAGRKAYVLAFPEETRSASAPEMNGPRTVWVDKETYFVLKVVQISGTDGRWLETVEVTSVQYNPAIDPALFSFTPPQGARLNDQRPKPAPTKDQFQQQMEVLARQADFPVFVPSRLPNGLVPRQPKMDDALGLQLEYVPPADAGGTSLPTMTIGQQRATYDLVSRWTEGAESVAIGEAKGWLRRGLRNVDGTGTDSAAMLLRDGTLVSVSSFTLSPEEIVKLAASLEPVPGSHTPLPDLGLEPRAPRPTPTPVPAPSFTPLRPAWLPEQMEVREQYQLDPTGNGSQLVIGFDPRPQDAKPHGVLTLTEMSKDALPSGIRPDPEETRETIGGREVRVISRGENWITLTWVQGDLALTLTNPYDPPGQPRYTPDELRKIVESIR